MFSPAKYQGGDCNELGRASIRCIEEHGYNRLAPECKPHFEAYKECKKKVTEERRKVDPSRGGLFG